MEALAFLEVAKACQEVVVVGSSSSSSSMMANASKECVVTKTRRALCLHPFGVLSLGIRGQRGTPAPMSASMNDCTSLSNLRSPKGFSKPSKIWS